MEFACCGAGMGCWLPLTSPAKAGPAPAASNAAVPTQARTAFLIIESAPVVGRSEVSKLWAAENRGQRDAARSRLSFGAPTFDTAGLPRRRVSSPVARRR